jgi:hypothetical protein
VERDTDHSPPSISEMKNSWKFISIPPHTFLACGLIKQAWRQIVYIRIEVFTAVTMKNVVSWDIKTQFVPHSRHITSPLQSPAS